MRFCYVGNFRHSHCTENHVAGSLRALGHRVTWVQEDEVAVDALPAVAHEHDALLYTRTWSVRPKVTSELLASLRAAGIPSIGVHLDLIWGLEGKREQMATSDPMFRCEHVFTADGDHDEQWARVDVNHHWLRAGVYRPECYDAAPDVERWGEFKVAFVGSYRNYHDAWPHRRVLIDLLRDWYGDQFVLVPTPGQPAVRGAALNALYATIPVVVGDSILQRGAGSRYWSDRVYETWGRGGTLVFPHVDALEDEIGRYPRWELGRWDDLRDTIGMLLADDAARAEVRTATAGIVRARCTYEERMVEMLTAVGLPTHGPDLPDRPSFDPTLRTSPIPSDAR